MYYTGTADMPINADIYHRSGNFHVAFFFHKKCSCV